MEELRISNMDKKKIIYITTRIFWPTDSGRKVALYYYCKGLHEKYGYEIYVYSFLEYGQTSVLGKEKPDFIKDVRIARDISKFEKLKNLFSKTLLCQEWPIQCSLYYNKENEKAIKEYCKQVNPDIVIVDMVRLATYYNAFEELECKKILDMDDMLSERYKRQLKNQFDASIAGQYSANLSCGINNLIKQKRIKNLILKFEKQLMYEAELRYAALYDKVIFVSHEESDKLNNIYPQKAIDIPLGVQIDRYIGCKRIEQQNNNICFVGNMYVAANIDTLEHIVEDILPYVKSDYKLFVIGKVSEELKNAYYKNEKIIFTGRVENIYDVAKNCKLFLAPIVYGSGIKTKILEAMAMNLPVITNDTGAEGIDVINQKHLIIENNNKKIAELVDYYLNNNDQAMALANNGQKLVFTKYNWEKIWEKFDNLV